MTNPKKPSSPPPAKALLLVLLIACFLGCTRSETAAKENPAAETTPAPSKVSLPKSEAPPSPPYSFDKEDEIRIDMQTTRRRIFALSRQESEKRLLKTQMKLSRCDQGGGKGDLRCDPRTTARYCMLLGDRYWEQGKTEEAQAFFLEALSRLSGANTRLEKDYQGQKDAPAREGAGEAARIMTVSYNAAKFHNQAYKDYAELARYQKRLVEVYLKLGYEKRAAEHWGMIENSIQTAARRQRDFHKDFEALKGIKDRIPEKYMAYFQEIVALAATQRIEEP